jgi:hypothetical protein
MNALKGRPDRKGPSSLPTKAIKPVLPLLLAKMSNLKIKI